MSPLTVFDSGPDVAQATISDPPVVLYGERGPGRSVRSAARAVRRPQVLATLHPCDVT